MKVGDIVKYRYRLLEDKIYTVEIITIFDSSPEFFSAEVLSASKNDHYSIGDRLVGHTKNIVK